MATVGDKELTTSFSTLSPLLLCMSSFCGLALFVDLICVWLQFACERSAVRRTSTSRPSSSAPTLRLVSRDRDEPRPVRRGRGRGTWRRDSEQRRGRGSRPVPGQQHPRRAAGHPQRTALHHTQDQRREWQCRGDERLEVRGNGHRQTLLLDLLALPHRRHHRHLHGTQTSARHIAVKRIG